jgi:hypothetical protein
VAALARAAPACPAARPAPLRIHSEFQRSDVAGVMFRSLGVQLAYEAGRILRRYLQARLQLPPSRTTLPTACRVLARHRTTI